MGGMSVSSAVPMPALSPDPDRGRLRGGRQDRERSSDASWGRSGTDKGWFNATSAPGQGVQPLLRSRR